MRLANATSPSRESKLTELMSRKYSRMGSSVRSDANAVAPFVGDKRVALAFVWWRVVHFGPLR
jgi:hypothetical protein